MKPMKYIYRIDNGVQRCYQVIVGRGLKQKMSKSFFDGVYMGKRKALAAAKIFRDMAVKKLLPIMEKRKKLRVYGKGYFEQWKTSGNWQYLYIIGTWYDRATKKQYQKYFKVSEHGYDKSVRLAKQWAKQREVVVA